MTSFRLNELLKGHLEVPGGLGAPSFVIVANQKAFDNLTPENKAALMKASGEAGAALIGKAWQAADERGRDDAKQRGQAIETLAPAEFEKWQPLLQAGDRRMDQESRAEGARTGASCSTTCRR